MRLYKIIEEEEEKYKCIITNNPNYYKGRIEEPTLLEKLKWFWKMRIIGGIDR